MLTIHRAGEDGENRLAYTLLRTDTLVGGFPSDTDLKTYWEKTFRSGDPGFRVINRAAGSLALSLPGNIKDQVAQDFGKSLRTAMRNRTLKIVQR